MNYKDIIERIAYFRNSKKVSARDLSFKIDKNEGYINKLEGKEFALPVPVLVNILNELEVSLEEFGYENYRTYENDKYLLDLIKSLSAEQREKLLEFLKITFNK